MTVASHLVPVGIATSEFRMQALLALGRHGMLTSAQLRRIMDRPPPLGSVRRAMTKLERDGLVASVSRDRAHTKTWFLTQSGMDAVAPVIPNPMPMTAAIAAGPYGPHLHGTNEVGLAAADVVGPSQVSWTHEHHLPLGSSRSLRPDALLTVTVTEGHRMIGAQWFVELDRGTEPIEVLARKFVAYLAYRNYRNRPLAARGQTSDLHWKTQFRAWPTVLIVLDCSNAERRIQGLSAWIASDPRLAENLNKIPTIAAPLAGLERAMRAPAGLAMIPSGDGTSWLSY